MKHILIFLLLAATALRCFAASVKLEWDPPEQGLPVTYTLLINSEGNLSQIEGITELGLTVTNLAPGVKHMFQVVAVNDYGPGPGSQILSYIASDPIEVDIPVLQAPTNIISTGLLLGSQTSWTLGLKWTDPNTNSVIGFIVRSRRPDGSVLGVTKTVARSVQVGQLPFGSTNTISIAAFDALGNESPESEPLSVSMVRSAPLGLRAVKYETVLKLP